MISGMGIRGTGTLGFTVECTGAEVVCLMGDCFRGGKEGGLGVTRGDA